MRILFESSKGCARHSNEDIYGISENIVWVIDGATAVNSNNLISNDGDVLWVVQELNRALKTVENPDSLITMLKEAIVVVWKKAIAISPHVRNLEINDLPTFSICMIRINKDNLDYICLGDCSIFVNNRPGKRFTDERIVPFRDMVNKTKRLYIRDKETYQHEVRKTVLETKKYINTEGGYRIGSLDPDSALWSAKGTLSIESGDRVLLCSDGFWPSIEELQLGDIREEDIYVPDRLDRITYKQRCAEELILQETGIDISDDETIILIEV